MWRMPRRKPFVPEGITLGARVSGRGRLGGAWFRPFSDVTGQIWSAAPPSGRNKRWWVVTPTGRAYLCDASDLTVLGQCVDTPLPMAA